MGDQFTDIGIFPDLCMDSMLPPGMVRARALGLDKCLMGIEQGFRSHHVTQVTNKPVQKYDDQWIKNWQRDASADAKGFQKSLSALQAEDRSAAQARNDLRALIGSQVKGLKGDVSGLDKKLGQTLGNVKEEYKGQVANLQDIFGAQTAAQQAAWSDQAALQSRNLQASLNKLGTEFQVDLLNQQKNIKSNYESAISAAQSSDEIARLKLEQQFKNRQHDQQVAFHKTTSDLAAKDLVFGTQLGGLRRDLGIETDKLTTQHQALQQNVTGQLGGFRRDITDYKSSLAEQKEAQDAYYEANKRHREMQIQDAERARTAASYASAGTALNKQVKGVRRAGTSKPGGIIRSRSPRQAFNRSGLRISSLNI